MDLISLNCIQVTRRYSFLYITDFKHLLIEVKKVHNTISEYVDILVIIIMF